MASRMVHRVWMNIEKLRKSVVMAYPQKKIVYKICALLSNRKTGNLAWGSKNQQNDTRT
jgi:hypothetical protein